VAGTLFTEEKTHQSSELRVVSRRKSALSKNTYQNNRENQSK